MKAEDLIKFLLSWKYRFCGIKENAVVFATEKSWVSFHLKDTEVIIRNKETGEKETYGYGFLTIIDERLYILKKVEDEIFYMMYEIDVAAKGETFGLD